MKDCCKTGSEKCGLSCGHCLANMSCSARVCFGVPMAIFGVFHFLNAQQMSSSILAGWPAATALVYLSGTALVLGGVAITINKHAKLGAIALSVLLLLIILTLDLPNYLAGGEGAQMAMMGLLKNVALLGGALSIAATSCGMCCLNKKSS